MTTEVRRIDAYRRPTAIRRAMRARSTGLLTRIDMDGDAETRLRSRDPGRARREQPWGRGISSRRSHRPRCRPSDSALVDTADWDPSCKTSAE
jgi:hypothetical protein